jgi:hypothetical protein
VDGGVGGKILSVFGVGFTTALAFIVNYIIIVCCELNASSNNVSRGTEVVWLYRISLLSSAKLTTIGTDTNA